MNSDRSLLKDNSILLITQKMLHKHRITFNMGIVDLKITSLILNLVSKWVDTHKGTK